jgi:hypothetical protein
MIRFLENEGEDWMATRFPFHKNIKLQNQATTRYYLFIKWKVGELGGHPIPNHH